MSSDRKNQMAVNTIEFIDQLLMVESDLEIVRTALEDFHSENLIIDLNTKSEQMLQYFIELEQKNQQDFIKRELSIYML